MKRHIKVTLAGAGAYIVTLFMVTAGGLGIDTIITYLAVAFGISYFLPNLHKDRAINALMTGAVIPLAYSFIYYAITKTIPAQLIRVIIEQAVVMLVVDMLWGKNK